SRRGTRMNGDTGAIAITERLFLGPPEAAVVFADLIPVDNASDAITVIKCGHSALLPKRAWDMAGEVLRRCGATEEHIAFRLGMRGTPGRFLDRVIEKMRFRSPTG